MKVYVYETAQEAVVYVRDGKITLIAEIGEAESIEWGIESVCGAELVYIEGAEATNFIEDGIDINELDDKTNPELEQRFVKWINDHNL